MATASKTARHVGTGWAATASPKNPSAASSLNAPGSPWKATLGASVIAAAGSGTPRNSTTKLTKSVMPKAIIAA